MMKYYKYIDNYGPPNGTVYIEASHGWAQRYIMLTDEEMIASNVKHPQWGLVLPDQPIDYEAVEELIPITEDEFGRIWDLHLRHHDENWGKVKLSYPIGLVIDGYLEIFYPQGVVVNIADIALGIANYEECKRSTEPQNLYSGNQVKAVVFGYDELNQWIKLGALEVSNTTSTNFPVQHL